MGLMTVRVTNQYLLAALAREVAPEMRVATRIDAIRLNADRTVDVLFVDPTAPERPEGEHVPIEFVHG